MGASFDTPAENKAFAVAQSFPFRLLADTDKRVGAAYGVKKADDEEWAEFARRVSFLIDPDGVIHNVYDVTDVASHPQRVLDDLASLQA